MKHERYRNYHELASYCKSEGLDTDYFIRANGILVNKKSWFKKTER